MTGARVGGVRTDSKEERSCKASVVVSTGGKGEGDTHLSPSCRFRFGMGRERELSVERRRAE